MWICFIWCNNFHYKVFHFLTKFFNGWTIYHGRSTWQSASTLTKSSISDDEVCSGHLWFFRRWCLTWMNYPPWMKPLTMHVNFLQGCKDAKLKLAHQQQIKICTWPVECFYYEVIIIINIIRLCSSKVLALGKVWKLFLVTPIMKWLG